MTDGSTTTTTVHPARRVTWRGKIVAGALLMCVAAVTAQFSSRDFGGTPWAAMVVGLAPPLCGLAAIFLLTAPPPPPPPGTRRRSILGIIAPLAAAVVVTGFFFPIHHRHERLEAVVRTIMFVCTPLAGAATYLHLARVVAAHRRRVPAAMFVLLAAMLVTGAILFATRYGHRRGIVANGWYYTAPGPGERVAPFGFALDWLIRPAVELEKFLGSPQWAAYLIVTVGTPVLCVALMLWLLAWRPDGDG